MKLWMKILIALVAGLVTGLILGPKAAALKPIGTIFLNLITMVIVPLVLASMTLGVSNINDPKKLGRVGIKTLIYYASTTIISILFGLALGTLFKPGMGMGLTTTQTVQALTTPSIKETLIAIVPTNPIASLVSGNVLQIIVFALFLGVSISFTGERGKPILEWFESLAEVMYRMTGIVMEFSPIGVFAIMASVSGTFGAVVLLPLAKLMIIYYIGCIIHMVVVFGGILFLFAKLNPLPFFRGMRDAITIAFSTASSSATLPVSMHCCQNNLGVSRNISSFVLPLGCTVNMNGTAMFQAISALFISQAYGIELTLYTITSIVVTATLSSVGTAGIPGSGFIMFSAVLASAGLPLEGLAIIAAIDRIRDMIGTVANTLGDAVVAVAVAKDEKELDEDLYYHQEMVQFEESEA